MLADYTKAKTFQDLCDINVDYLKGVYDETPYSGAPIFEETKLILQPLCLLNSLGCYTYCGQPPGHWVERGYIFESRGYLEFFIETKYIESLVSFLSTQPIYYGVHKGVRTYPLPCFYHREMPIGHTSWYHDGACISLSEFCAFEDEKRFHVERGVDPKILEDCIPVVVVTRDFNQLFSLEVMMIEFFCKNRL